MKHNSSANPVSFPQEDPAAFLDRLIGTKGPVSCPRERARNCAFCAYRRLERHRPLRVGTPTPTGRAPRQRRNARRRGSRRCAVARDGGPPSDLEASNGAATRLLRREERAR